MKERICLRCGKEAVHSKWRSGNSLYDWGCRGCGFEWDMSLGSESGAMYALKSPEGRGQVIVPHGCMAVECWEIKS